MKSSPHRYSYCSRLYSKWLQAVTLGLLCTVLLATASAQFAKRPPTSKGPRALGLLELASNGKAHVVPVTIMIDGRFYDASVYKADPVPMALESGTVYEALKSGALLGFFTVGGALQSESRGWIGDGKWRSIADIEAEKARTKAEREKRAQKAPPPESEIGGPPKLRRGSDSASNTPAQNPSSSTQSSPSTNSPPSQNPSAKQEGTNSRATSERESPQKSAPTTVEDPNRPILRRQAPSETPHEQTKAGIPSEPLKGVLQLIPAISDADGPDPRPYSYQLKPEEDQAFLKKMLALAADEVRGRAQISPEKSGSKSKTAAPEFHDVQLRAFDLSNMNEPVLVLTANASVLSAASSPRFTTAIVARQDAYGDLHKVFATTTDNQHLDISPKYELIDAVDANGDGAGELLFRMTSEGGSAFGVYRVIGDKLWPLFEGRPGR
jgi:hypothetical protein